MSWDMSWDVTWKMSWDFSGYVIIQNLCHERWHDTCHERCHEMSWKVSWQLRSRRAIGRWLTIARLQCHVRDVIVGWRRWQQYRERCHGGQPGLLELLPPSPAASPPAALLRWALHGPGDGPGLWDHLWILHTGRPYSGSGSQDRHPVFHTKYW